MESPNNPTRAYLKELLWWAALVNLILALIGLLVGTRLGDVWLGLALFLGGGLAVTGLLGLVVAVNVCVAWWRDRRRED